MTLGDTDFRKNNLTAPSVGDMAFIMISSLLPFGRPRAKLCEINFLKICGHPTVIPAKLVPEKAETGNPLMNLMISGSIIKN